MKEFIRGLRVLIVFSILLGIIYPLGVTVIAQLLIPGKANGSLIKQQDTVIGSTLIGQEFSRPEYFHSRPSAVNYDAAASGASNLGPSNQKLMTQISERIAVARKENNIPVNKSLPADLVLSSASGLDPQISLESALLQVGRIAKIRKIPENKIKEMIYEELDHDFLGIWGAPGVNVLKLNLELNKIKTQEKA